MFPFKINPEQQQYYKWIKKYHQTSLVHLLKQPIQPNFMDKGQFGMQSICILFRKDGCVWWIRKFQRFFLIKKENFKAFYQKTKQRKFQGCCPTSIWSCSNYCFYTYQKNYNLYRAIGWPEHDSLKKVWRRQPFGDASSSHACTPRL